LLVNPALRPLIILGLVLAEVGLWQCRVQLTGRGRTGLPTLLGVLGAVLQVTAIAQVVTHVQDPLTVAAYAVGVGGGVLGGVLVTSRFATDAVRVSLLTTDSGLDDRLRTRGWAVVAYEGQGAAGAVRLLEIVAPGRLRRLLLRDLQEVAPVAVRTVEVLDRDPSLVAR
jgi:uncharacterized protein YebE (UPF0316 family)